MRTIRSILGKGSGCNTSWNICKSQCLLFFPFSVPFINHLTPKGHYMGRTPQLTSRCCILYIYSTNIRTEYFKHTA